MLQNRSLSVMKKLGLGLYSVAIVSLKKTYLKTPLFNKLVARRYLTSSYKLEDVWHQRLQDSHVKEVKPVEFYYDLIRKYRKEDKVAAIDVDLFINSIDNQSVSSLSDEIEEVLRLLRRSPETNNALASTTHTAVRMLFESENYHLLMKLLWDPTNYGIFLESYLANILMDKFLTDKNYTYAARVASSLMLQEDFGTPLTKSLILLSCFKYALNIGKNEEWIDHNYVPEPEEEVKLVVSYIRNPYFDDHFDLRDPLHIVGKTLAWVAPLLQEPFKANAQVLGWCLFEKWSKLEESLVTNGFLSEQVYSIVTQQVEEKCADKTVKEKLVSLITNLKNRINDVQNFNLVENIEKLVNEEIEKCEETDMKKQIEVYNSYSITRKDAINKQLELYEKNRLMLEIEAKKKYLKEKEEVIFYFDNKDKIEMELLKKRQLYPDELSEKEKAKAEEKEYISPEVKRRQT